MYEAVASAIAAGTSMREFAFVFCNRDPGEDPLTDSFLRARGRRTATPLVTKSSVAYRRAVGGRVSRPGEPLPAWRIEYDRAVEAALAPHPFDVGVLAGYMLIFEREFVSQHVVLNLHPALPSGPAGTWREVIRQLIRTRAAESGVMLHLAIPEVDAGPVVAYCRYPLDDPALAPLWRAASRATSSARLDDAALEATRALRRHPRAGVRARGAAARRRRSRSSPPAACAPSGWPRPRCRGSLAAPADVTAVEVDALAPHNRPRSRGAPLATALPPALRWRPPARARRLLPQLARTQEHSP